jgi:hypothetical protein
MASAGCWARSQTDLENYVRATSFVGRPEPEFNNTKIKERLKLLKRLTTTQKAKMPELARRAYRYLTDYSFFRQKAIASK